MALSRALHPIPTRINLPWENPFPLARAYIPAATPKPIITAKSETRLPLIPNTSMAITAAKLEPEVIPIISGLARGFCKIFWKVLPDIPKARPHKSPAIVRGSLRDIIVKAPSSVVPSILPIIVLGEYMVFP